MTRIKALREFASLMRLVQVGLFFSLLTGCVTTNDLQVSVNELDAAYRAENDKLFADIGTRVINGVTQKDAYSVAISTAHSLGFAVDEQNPGSGEIAASAPGPTPLTAIEWAHVADVETPRAQSVLVNHIGLLGYFGSFDADGTDVLAHVSVSEVIGGAEIRVTIGVHRPTSYGVEYGSQAPPSAVKLGIEKFWTTFEQKLRDAKIVATGWTSGPGIARAAPIASTPVGTGPQTLTPSLPSRVAMTDDGGTFLVPVLINDTITLNFTVDSGATDVSIPIDVFSTLVRAGTIVRSDFIGKQMYILADGSKLPSATFVIRSLKVGNLNIQNIRGSISPAQGDLLLGQSFLRRFKSWSIDNSKHELVLE
jgi:gag-polyprotein putative aspartyl protease